MLNLTNQEKILIASYANILGEGSAEFYFTPEFELGDRCLVAMRKPTGEETYNVIHFELPNLHGELVGTNKWFTEKEIFNESPTSSR